MSKEIYFSRDEYFSAVMNENVPQDKPVVHYHTLIVAPEVDLPAMVIPIDHPAAYLNGDIVTTSYVVSIDENGTDFETRNTKYVYKPNVKH